ncbi:esterase family protein [Pedobacter sp. ASV28]|uniref:alpha/beta hydrolase n=1 Tax=Pedobacter sp. ASV28 TaxID=2795123 RepID=UPI0018EDFA7F|nr:alpha/beta hydrolase-fold protein [Pedobacter sp. ASV28]
MYSTLLLPTAIKSIHSIKSKYLEREVELEIYLPENLLGNEYVNLLLVNDGQDLAEMGMEEILDSLYEKWKIDPVVVVGIKAGKDRLLEYGIAGEPDFKQRGSKAELYAGFIVHELLPFVKSEIPVKIKGKTAFAGFSLGGLTAFDIAWKHDGIFDMVGVFSGSFWWRKRDLSDGYTDNDRILHEMIRKTKGKPSLKFWLMTGTEDEKADRNQNFIIDSIDDTIDVVKELLKKTYSRPDDIFYYEMVGGKHDVPTWTKAMPKFLIWAFGKS